jgi:hypothetical protein
MRSHLKDPVSESSSEYSLLFREMFCVSAQSLADSMSLPLESLGITYDEILVTGIIQSQYRSGLFCSISTSYRASGQCLFLVKHASKAETAHLLAAGYRFAEPDHVVGIIARAMQITRDEAERQMKNMSEYYGPHSMFQPGVHIGFFGMRPNMQKGFNVIVRKDLSYSIPSLQLPVAQLNAAQKRFVLSFAGMSVVEILRKLRAPPTGLDYEIRSFRYFPAVHILTSDLTSTAP